MEYYSDYTDDLLYCMYRILPSKRPWVVEIYGPKTGVGAYTERPFVCINHRIIKIGGWRLHRDGRLLGRIQYTYIEPFRTRRTHRCTTTMFVHVHVHECMHQSCLWL